MAAFAKSSFNAQIYSASRPTYPQYLFDFVFRYHESIMRETRLLPRRELAVDLGCGTGQATIGLRSFEQVIGIDPSKTMIRNARKYVAKESKKQGSKKQGGREVGDQFKFIEGTTEDLSFLQRGSVDLVIAAQAAHWFDWHELWPALARVVRKNGTVAAWGYSEMRFTRYPSLTPLINEYTHGTDPRTSLGPHWQQPGRSIVENLLRDIPTADSVVPDQFFAERRVYFSGPHFPSIPDTRPVLLRKVMSWDNFEAYLRSFSSLNTFQAKYPEDTENPEGDIVQRFMTILKAAILKEELHNELASRSGVGRLEESSSDNIEIEWPLALILVKKA